MHVAHCSHLLECPPAPPLLAEVMGTSLLAWYLFSSRPFIILSVLFLGFCLSRWEMRAGAVCLHVPLHITQCCVYRGHPGHAIGSQMAESDKANSHFRTVPGRFPRIDHTHRDFPGMMAGGGRVWQPHPWRVSQYPGGSDCAGGRLMNRRWQRAEWSTPKDILKGRWLLQPRVFCFVFVFGNSFTEVYFTYHKIHLFNVYNLTIFSNFTKWCNHHGKSVLEHIHPPIRVLSLTQW